MPNATVWTELHDLAARASAKFGTPKDILFEPLLPRNRAKMDGQSWRYPGGTPMIQLRVHRYHRPRQSLRRSTIMATFAHELAHLGAWGERPEHGPKWRVLVEDIAAWLRGQGQPVSTNLRHGTYPRCKRKRRK